ncbi:acyltransferase domain-containing protein [Amycolatopsis sp. OK19-0408]|uniref:Acyltransferase domain-containing protein n=1 Tax=Amycolatopsis iheyensis TaxID=2945988 RepID=A0A9X2SL45_9PSEU|nr:type I polyketide synthase [Amycolatopsis iheyensis]MCR6485828.1 acyltransferase domain-containing protein [Amycolatopsis iheyensis]
MTDPGELRRWLTERIAGLAGLSPELVDSGVPPAELGLSSRDVVTVAAELGELLGHEPDLGLLWRYPSIAALATALADGSAADARPRPRPGEPVAVLGLGCRLPGGIESPDELWRALLAGSTVLGTPPADRRAWFAPGRRGAFLADVAGFDAGFFGIGAAEAAAMDPRQRIVLETTWAALEHAGIAPGTLRGSRTGVFAGVSAEAASMIANRVSDRFDLRGPSLVVDTADSAALVAVHHAVRALAAGEADLALATGIHLLLAPAEGVPGEGCGVVVLKRLTDARRDGDRVLAVLRGSAVGSDGRAAGPAAREQVLADAHAVASSEPSTVDYVEVHGDPLEARALDVVLGRGRAPRRPVLLGCARTGFGNLEAAAGILGLLKVVLALWHDRIPPSPRFTADGGRLSVVDKAASWPRYGGTARAGVSASGAGGTHAHVVLEEWPKPLEPAAPGSRWNGRPQVFTVSARSERALCRRAGELAGWLAGPGRGTAPGDLAATLARRREQLPLRAAVVTSSRAALTAGLRAVAGGGATADVVRGTTGRETPRPVFVFSGYGSQWPAMGRRLLSAEPEFRVAVAALEPLFLAKAGFSLRGALRQRQADLGDPATARPLVFGAQVALAAWWRAHGVEPAAVLGHSMGEVAAAVVAGALDPGEGLDIVVSRAKLLAGLPVEAMALVELSAAELRARFPAVTVVVEETPTQCAVLGPPEDITALVTQVDGLGRWARRISVAGAGHSAAVEPVLPAFRAALGGLRPRAPLTACYSSVLDDPRAVPVFDADHWVTHLRRPVRFDRAVAAAVADGHRWFLEISPHPIALPAVERIAHAAGADVRTLATLSRRDGEENAYARSLAELHTAGHPAVLTRRYREAPVLDLPPPPWERHAFRPPRRTDGHPLLGTRVEVPDEDRHLWQATITPDEPAWLGEHRVRGVPVFPATGFLELFLAGARQLLGAERVRVDGLEVHRMLAITGETLLSTEIRADGAAVVRARAGAGWVRHATAWVSADTEPAPAALSEVDHLPADPGDPGYVLHPVRAARCVRALAAAGQLATGIGRVRLLGDPRRAVRFAATPAEVQLLAADGEVVADLADVRFQDPGRAPLAARAFGTGWVETPLRPVPPREPGSWLLLTDEHPVALGRAVALAVALAEAGDEALSLPRDDLDELPGFLAGRAVRGVVFLTGAPHAYHDPEDARELLRAVLDVVTRLGDGVRLHLVTQSSGEPGLVFLRGLVRVLAFDRPELRASLVDLDARSDVDSLVRELRSAAPEDEVRWRHDVRYAARLTRVPLVDGGATGPGAYVITGGFGTLGRATARRLAADGATRIVLCGRSAGVAGLSGVDVVVVAGDIAEPGVAERLVAAATADGLPLRGIVHAAGDGWRAKVLGARRLHEATADTPPDWWLLYSSSAALLGAPGRTAQATADAWLDAFAEWRRSRGLPAATVNWGPWAAGDPMPLAEGLDALPAVLASDRPSVGITRFDAGRVAAQFPELTRRPFFSAVLDDVPGPAATPHERLADILAGLLGCAPHEVTRDVPLIELGLDSLTAMRARTAAEREFGVTLPVPLLLRGASLADLAEYVTAPALQLRVLRPGTGTPLALFGDAGGYAPLLDRLGDVPCYGFAGPGTAARCAEVLRAAGVRRLAGGVLAYETARRLASLGEPVDVVVLLDPGPAPAAPYAGRVVLFHPRDTDPAPGWSTACADLHVEPVPGDHGTMLDPPHVDVLAGHLAAELAGHTTPGPTPV